MLKLELQAGGLVVILLLNIFYEMIAYTQIFIGISFVYTSSLNFFFKSLFCSFINFLKFYRVRYIVYNCFTLI